MIGTDATGNETDFSKGGIDMLKRIPTLESFVYRYQTDCRFIQKYEKGTKEYILLENRIQKHKENIVKSAVERFGN